MVLLDKRCLMAGLMAALLLSPGFGADRGPQDLPDRVILEAIPLERVDDRALPAPVDRGSESSRRASFGSHNCRLPGEFEHQSGLLLSCHELLSSAPELFVEVVRETQGRIEIIALVSSLEEFEAARYLLRTYSATEQHVRFVEISHDTMWARDYGPMILKPNAGRPVVIDANYDLERVNDDRVPDQLARLLQLDVVRMPLRVDGGNLISNGNGLALTTRRLMAENSATDLDADSICEVIRAGYGLKQVVVLDPLVGEPTGHVDMFASWTSTNTVVVGQYDPKIDPENAAILDRNADQLSTIRGVTGPLRVVRIPMPPHDDGIWRTYTNVIYANGVLLVPTYGDVDHAERMRTLRTFATLLPQWRIVGVDASGIIESNGALHCITMNLGSLGRLSNVWRADRTRRVSLISLPRTSFR